jgi:hypothetical protein
MISNYVKNSIPQWTQVVDSVASKGGKIYVLPRCAAEYSMQLGHPSLPEQFVVLSSDQDISVSVENALRGLNLFRKLDLISVLVDNLDFKGFTLVNWEAASYQKLENDLKMLLEIGWFTTCLPIDIMELLTKKVVFLTGNMTLSKKLLRKEVNRRYKSFVVANCNFLTLEGISKLWSTIMVSSISLSTFGLVDVMEMLLNFIPDGVFLMANWKPTVVNSAQ